MDWLLQPAVVAALIAAVVSAVGLLVSLEVGRRTIDTQVKLKSQELQAQADLKLKELESLAAKLRVEQEGLRQAQLTEILKKRIETYPALYEILAVYGRNWEIEGKRHDHAWARAFLRVLIENNAKNGAFFSQTVYDHYSELRTALEHLTKDLASGRQATREEVDALYEIIRGVTLPSGERAAGLGTYIKDELGSYITTVVSAAHPGLEPATHIVSKPQSDAVGSGDA
jgi:hypothetical protein